MELVIHEENRFGKEAVFTGKESRQPTLTDVKILSPMRGVAANREAAKLYLIDLSAAVVIHVVDTIFDNIPHFPDLLEVVDNIVYIVNFDGWLTVFEITGDILIPKEAILLDASLKLHGIQYHNEHLWMTVSQGKKGVLKYNLTTKKTSLCLLKGNGDNSIKDIAFLDNTRAIILTCTNTPQMKEVHYDAYVCFVRLLDNMFHTIDFLKIHNTHLDSVICHNRQFFVTAHSESRAGFILLGTINEAKTKIMSHSMKTTPDFPHGIDIAHGMIAYTAYCTSALYVFKLEDWKRT